MRGLRARGNATIDIRWHEGIAESTALHAGSDGPLTIRSTLFSSDYTFTDISDRAILLRGTATVRTFDARAGMIYEIKRQERAASAARLQIIKVWKLYVTRHRGPPVPPVEATSACKRRWPLAAASGRATRLIDLIPDCLKAFVYRTPMGIRAEELLGFAAQD